MSYNPLSIWPLHIHTNEMSERIMGLLSHDQNSVLNALPKWARDTLNIHASDVRPKTCTRKQFETATSGDDVWDAMQRCLMVNGELHNNLRMTWGKAFVSWSLSPSEGLCTALDLNHRYALDGGMFWDFDYDYTMYIHKNI